MNRYKGLVLPPVSANESHKIQPYPSGRTPNTPHLAFDAATLLLTGFPETSVRVFALACALLLILVDVSRGVSKAVIAWIGDILFAPELVDEVVVEGAGDQVEEDNVLVEEPDEELGAGELLIEEAAPDHSSADENSDTEDSSEEDDSSGSESSEDSASGEETDGEDV